MPAVVGGRVGAPVGAGRFGLHVLAALTEDGRWRPLPSGGGSPHPTRLKCTDALWQCTALAEAFVVVAVAEDMSYAQPNEAWVSINGTVEAVTPDSFTLDYGGGLIVVDMNDGDRDADAYKLMEGDQGNFIGKIDDDLFETSIIEARTVYVEKLGTTSFASAVDEEDVVLSAEVPLDLTE